MLHKVIVPEWTTAKIAGPYPFHGIQALNKEVHIYRIDLNPTEDIVTKVAAVLSADEKTRADRFHFEKHRRRFIVCRGVLRHILKQYLATNPAEILFSYSRSGKPEVSADKNGIGLSFNLSHSSELSLLAVTRKRTVGIDLERLVSNLNTRSLAQRYFSSNENIRIDIFDDDLHRYFFYGFWTLKESYLKATGEGLADLENAAIETFPWGHPKLKESDRKAETGSWHLLSFVPAKGYISALAVEGKDFHARFFAWQHDTLSLCLQPFGKGEHDPT